MSIGGGRCLGSSTILKGGWRITPVGKSVVSGIEAVEGAYLGGCGAAACRGGEDCC